MSIDDNNDVDRKQLRQSPSGGHLDLSNEFGEDKFFEDEDVIDELHILVDHV